MIFIAEVKIVSPFGYVSQYSWDYLLSIAIEHGDEIAIHTEGDFGGSFDLIKRARNLTDKPILAKGFHSDDEKIEKALDVGASEVLVVGRIPATKYLSSSILEPISFAQLNNWNISQIPKIMWNDRDFLNHGKRKDQSWNQIQNLKPKWICQASFIKNLSDVHTDADAFIVGEHLQSIVNDKKELTLVNKTV